jgi:hypothetical protein
MSLREPECKGPPGRALGILSLQPSMSPPLTGSRLMHTPPRLCSLPQGLVALELHSLGGLVGLGGVLGSAVLCSAAGGLEGHGAACTLVENLAVPLLDMAFQQGQGQVDDTTVDAPGQQGGAVRPRWCWKRRRNSAISGRPSPSSRGRPFPSVQDVRSALLPCRADAQGPSSQGHAW